MEIEDELYKAMKNMAATTGESCFTSITLEAQDLAGAGNEMALHCLTAEDNLSAVALTKSEYGSKNGKKMLREVVI